MPRQALRAPSNSFEEEIHTSYSGLYLVHYRGVSGQSPKHHKAQNKKYIYILAIYSNMQQESYCIIKRKCKISISTSPTGRDLHQCSINHCHYAA